MLTIPAIALFLGRAQSGAKEPISTAFAARCFQEAKWASDDDGGKLWGRPLYGPTILVDAETRFAVANQADKEGQLQARDGVWVGHLPDDVTIANTATLWAGVTWTMVVAPLPSASAIRTQLLMHESWHRIQEAIGLPPAVVPNAHLDTRDGRIWLRLEWHALARALVDLGPERKAAITDALVFRAYRRSLFPHAAAEEDRMEVHEGLAEYTGTALMGLGNAGARWYMAGRLKVDEQRASYPKSFAYETGPAYGLLLDADGADWRKGLSPASSLSGLLAKAEGAAIPADFAGAARRAAGPYGGSEVMREETQHDREHQALLTRYRKALLTGPTLDIPLDKANYSFDPNTVVSMGDDGTVFPSCQISGPWGVITINKGVRIGAKFDHAYVSAPGSAADRKGDGWTLILSPGWHIESTFGGRMRLAQS